VAQTSGVEAYSGFDGEHFAQHRTIVSLPVAAGESNELAFGPDGRIRMGISAPCDHCTPASRWSATVVSFRPDGSALTVDASGIRAPVGLVYVPGTRDLLVTMNQRDDLGPRTPGDWLAVVRSGRPGASPAAGGRAAPPAREYRHRWRSTAADGSLAVGNWSTGTAYRITRS